MANSTQLNRCPFCGNKAAVEFETDEDNFYSTFGDDKEYDGTGGWFVICNVNKKGCGSSSGWHQERNTAALKWNTRKHQG